MRRKAARTQTRANRERRYRFPKSQTSQAYLSRAPEYVHVFRGFCLRFGANPTFFVSITFFRKKSCKKSTFIVKMRGIDSPYSGEVGRRIRIRARQKLMHPEVCSLQGEDETHSAFACPFFAGRGFGWGSGAVAFMWCERRGRHVNGGCHARYRKGQ